MDSSAADSVYPRSTTTLSLHERFSQVLVDQLTGSRTRTRTVDTMWLQQPKGRGPLQTRHLSPGVKQRFRSVWTRLGGQQQTRLLSTCRPPGYWSFMNKYRSRTSFTCRGRGQHRLLRKRNIKKLKGRTHLHRGGASAPWRRGFSKIQVPTKEQLDAQLDEYMSMSKTRLDAQLDEYMSMAGQDWG